MKTSRVGVVLIVFLVISAAGCGSVDGEPRQVAEPSPTLSPAAVVSAQLSALSKRGEAEDGIEVAYRFASPANREGADSLSEFRSRFEDPLYEPMVGHRDAEVFSATVQGDLAIVPVSLVDDEGSEVDYVFVLTRQREEPYENMWMIDGVQIHSPDDPDSELK